jgi:hypothetical protein
MFLGRAQNGGVRDALFVKSENDCVKGFSNLDDFTVAEGDPLSWAFVHQLRETNRLEMTAL